MIKVSRKYVHLGALFEKKEENTIEICIDLAKNCTKKSLKVTTFSVSIYKINKESLTTNMFMAARGL